MDINENLRISTMTLISGIDSNIDLRNLYENLEINEHFRYIEYGSNPVKGEKHNKIKNPRKKKEIKYFYNQITIHVYVGKIVNLKVFNNGRFQMTGIKNIEQGVNVVNILYNFIVNLEDKKKEAIIDNLTPVKNEIKIGMINSDFDAKFKINREILHRIVISRGYYSSYEPTIYPGVNIKYYYNQNDNAGICKCTSECNGKGKGCCKKITVAVFNSGKTIITGAQSYDHLNKAYDFITNVINDKKEEIKQ